MPARHRRRLAMPPRAALALLLAAALLGAMIPGGALAEEESPMPLRTDPAEEMKGLAFLAGTWKGPVGPGTWEALYTTPSGGEIHSSNKEIREGRTVSFEFERFHIQDGSVVMTPWVKGVKSVDFTLTSLDTAARKATFENPKHDFPQRIIYHRVADDRLEIHVQARRGDAWRGFQLKLARAR